MSPPEYALTLADLPSDIIRVIVKMEPQSTASVRLVSIVFFNYNFFRIS